MQLSTLPVAPEELRGLIRRGDLVRPTGGMAPGRVQANLAILPKELAFDFPGVLPAQSKALSPAGGGRGRLARAEADGARGRPEVRRGQVQGVPARRHGGRGRGDFRVLARRPGQLPAGMQLYLRGGADAGGDFAASHRSRHQRVDVHNRYSDDAGRGCSPGRWWSP